MKIDRRRALTRTLLPLILLACAGRAAADIRLRVSVKFILDASGNRTTGLMDSDEDVAAAVEQASAILEALDRGYSLELLEVLDVAGQSEYFGTCNIVGLDAEAQADPSAFELRTDAVNIYLTGGGCGGACSFPDGGRLSLILGEDAWATTMLHESGHFFDLCHTQGCSCGECSECSAPEDDGFDDTLPDRECWTQDDIAEYSFGVDYAELSTDQQEQVDDVWWNVMSYHNLYSTDVLTWDQLDHLADIANVERADMASGRTVFVDHAYDGFETGSSYWPWDTFQEGVDAAAGGDVVLVRTGTYEEGPLTITKAIALRNSRGDAVIR